MRIGIATGPVTAGVIGRAKISYDVWGDTVKSRLPPRKPWAVPGRIHVSLATCKALGAEASYEPPLAVELKGFGIVETVFIVRRSAL